MFNFKKITAALTLFAAACTSQASVISGNFNSNGYALLDLNLAGNTQVDFNFTAGNFDALFSLFDNNGVHLITADDTAFSSDPHLTQVLAGGKYTLAVSACCSSWLQNASFASTDGFNQDGAFWVGGTSSLDVFLAGHSGASGFANAAYALDFTSISLDNQGGQGGNVPEPGSPALFGASLAALAWARRRQRRD